jgi:hypothetical protein
MHSRTGLATALVLLAISGAASAAPTSRTHTAQDDGMAALAGEWLYVEDITEGRPREEQGPPMSVRFTLRVEDDAIVMPRSGGREDRLPHDGSTIEIPGSSTVSHCTGEWKDGALAYQTRYVSVADDSTVALILKEFRPTADGLLVHIVVGSPPQRDSTALYRHPEDIALPAPARGAVGDLAWLAGPWVGMRGSRSIEERWSPPLGGALLGVSRTISKGSMVAFEYLRVVERDGGLVYVAQPNGGSATEFVLTELGATRAVFENPRHDSPQRIVYELSAEGGLTASIGFINGGRPTLFEFEREEG